jgi:hypothetical protein
MIKKTLLQCIALGLLSACASTGWNATQHHDDFTGTKICRVERGSQASRDFARGFTGIYFTQHFYAENHDGEIRAGVRTEPPLPIGGDIQIKVEERLYILTSADVPIDVAPVNPQISNNVHADSMEAMTKSIQQLSSPYRAYRGEKAKALLRDIARAQGEIKFRVVGVNSTLGGVGTFTADEGFRLALSKCNIAN